MKKIKKPNFPTEFFISPQEYVDFAKKHRVFGADAIKLKKEMMKKSAIPEPIIKRTIEDDYLDPL